MSNDVHLSVVRTNLLLLVVDDIGGDIVEETRVVTNDQAGDIVVRNKILLQPLDGGLVQLRKSLV